MGVIDLSEKRAKYIRGGDGVLHNSVCTGKNDNCVDEMCDGGSTNHDCSQ